MLTAAWVEGACAITYTDICQANDGEGRKYGT